MPAILPRATFAAALAAAVAVACGDATPAGSTTEPAAEPADASELLLFGEDAAIPPDAASTSDAGPPADASNADASAPPDASNPPDASSPDASALPDAAEPPDAATPDAGPLRPIQVEGFGAATVGGWQPGYTSYVVTDLADDGPGTLREGLRTNDQPRVITFALDGTIDLTTPMLVPSNVTVDGRGRKITIRGKGLILAGSDEVILLNFAVSDVKPNSEDGVRIGDPTGGASTHVVLDHLRFFATGSSGDSTTTDEAISVIFGSTDITLSWLRFDDWEKVMLFGNGDAPAAVDSNIRVTVHHNYAHATGRRHPQARYGTYDFYDCFFDDWRMYGWFFQSPYRESFGSQAQDSARVVVENTFYRRSSHTYDSGSQANDATRCETSGVLEGRNLQVAAGGNATLKFGVGCPTTFTPWVRPYAATIDPADAALQTRLTTETGNTL